MLLGGIAADAKAQTSRSSAAIAVEYERVFAEEAEKRRIKARVEVFPHEGHGN